MTETKMKVKRIIAREWLYFLAWVFVVPMVLSPILCVIFGQPWWTPFADPFIFHLEDWEVWVIILGPYLAFMFIRSIIWAYRVVRV
jgi:hypothetical protein